MLLRGFARVNIWLKIIKLLVFLSYLPSNLSINNCNSFPLRKETSRLLYCSNDSLDLQHSTPEMPHSVRYLWNGPGTLENGIGTRGSTLSLPFCDWLFKGDLPPQPLLICCCRAKVRHSLGCSPDSRSLLLWGHRRSAAAGCLPVSQQRTQNKTLTPH